MLSASQYTALRALVNCPGPTGSNGADGINGTNGSTGPKGDTGPAGVTGAQGLQGIGSNTTQSFSVRGLTASPWFQTSIDGTNWVNSPTVSFSAPTDIVWNGTLWVAGTLSTTAQFAYSVDGTNWNVLSITPFGTKSGAGPRAIVWNGKLWVAVGDPGTSPTSTDVTVAYSYDGLTWTGVASSYSTVLAIGYDIAWNGRVFVAVGNAVSGTSFVATSQNGTTWTPISVSATGLTAGRCVAWNGTRWVVGGASTTSSDVKMMYSTVLDASIWVSGTWIGNPFNNECRSVFWNGSMWIAVGGTPSGSFVTTLARSSNGATWTAVLTNATTPALSNGQSIVWNGLYWIATGDTSEELVYSANGTSWTTIVTTAAGSALASRYVLNDIYPVPYINVRDLGALGDGVTDDSTVITSALTLASNYPNGATVVVPAGTYNYSSATLSIPNKVDFIVEQGASILNSGSPVTVQFSASTTGNSYFETRTGESSRISDYTGRVITGSLTQGTSPGDFGTSDGADSTMFDIRYDNAYVSATSATISITGWATNTFTVSASRTFRKNQAITFNSAIATNIVVGTVYYIFADVVGTTFQITASPNGTLFGLSGSTASGTAVLYEGDGTLRGLNVRDVLNNPSNVAGGNRVAVNGRIQQERSTTTGAIGSRYIGVGGYSTTTSGDSGTGLTVSTARGSYIGGNFYGSATTSSSTNILTVTGVESNAEVGTSAASTHIVGVASVGSVDATAGAAASANAAYTIGGATGPNGQSHGGWSTGILFTNLHGQDPLRASSKLIGSYWNSGATTRTITDGIDLSGFDMTGDVLKSKNITLTDSTSSISIISPSGTTGTTTLTSKALTLGSDTTTGRTVVKTASNGTTLQLQGSTTTTGGVEILDFAGTSRLTVRGADSGNVVVNPASGASGTTTLTGTSVQIAGVASTAGTTTLNNNSLQLGSASNSSTIQAVSGTSLIIRPNTSGDVRITNAAASTNRILTTDTNVTLASDTTTGQVSITGGNTTGGVTVNTAGTSGTIRLQNNGTTVASVRSTGIDTTGLTASGGIFTTGLTASSGIATTTLTSTSGIITTGLTATSNFTALSTGAINIRGGNVVGGVILDTSAGTTGTVVIRQGGNDRIASEVSNVRLTSDSTNGQVLITGGNVTGGVTLNTAGTSGVIRLLNNGIDRITTTNNNVNLLSSSTGTIELTGGSTGGGITINTAGTSGVIRLQNTSNPMVTITNNTITCHRKTLIRDDGTNTRIETDTSLGPILYPVTSATAPALITNGQNVITIVDNSNLRVSLRGTDATTRNATIPLNNNALLDRFSQMIPLGFYVYSNDADTNGKFLSPYVFTWTGSGVFRPLTFLTDPGGVSPGGILLGPNVTCVIYTGANGTGTPTTYTNTTTSWSLISTSPGNTTINSYTCFFNA